MSAGSEAIQPLISPATDECVLCTLKLSSVSNPFSVGVFGCPEDSPYAPMGICSLILKISLGSVAPFIPMLDVIVGLPESVTDVPSLPSLAVDLPGLPFIAIGLQDLPPIPISIPGFGIDLNIGDLQLPAWDGLSLGKLLVSILTIPINFAIDMLTFKIPDLSFEGILELVLGSIAIGLGLPAIMLPQLGLLDFAICIVKLVLFPIIFLLTLLGGDAVIDTLTKSEDDGGAGIEVPPIPSPEEMQTASGGNLSDDEKKVIAEAVIAKMVAEEEEQERVKKQAELNQEQENSSPSKSYKKWKPSVGDDYYG